MIRRSPWNCGPLHSSIRPGYHASKRHWNTVELDGSVDDSTLREMIRLSYELVVSRMPAAQRDQLREAGQKPRDRVTP